MITIRKIRVMRIVEGALRHENNQNSNLLDLAGLHNGKLHTFRPEVAVGGNFRLPNMALIKIRGDGKIGSMHRAKWLFCNLHLKRKFFFN